MSTVLFLELKRDVSLFSEYSTDEETDELLNKQYQRNDKVDIPPFTSPSSRTTQVPSLCLFEVERSSQTRSLMQKQKHTEFLGFLKCKVNVNWCFLKQPSCKRDMQNTELIYSCGAMPDVATPCSKLQPSINCMPQFIDSLLYLVWGVYAPVTTFMLNCYGTQIHESWVFMTLKSGLGQRLKSVLKQYWEPLDLVYFLGLKPTCHRRRAKDTPPWPPLSLKPYFSCFKFHTSSSSKICSSFHDR